MIGGMKKDMLRNSLLYIKRKKKKSIIVLFILTAILISLYTCFYIKELRKQLGLDCIKTIRNVGYKITIK